MPKPSFTPGASCKVRLGNVKIKGINSLTVPEFMRETIKVEEFEQDFAFEETSGGSYGRIVFRGNYVVGDSQGQDVIRRKLVKNEKITDLRLYVNGTDFWTCDIAADEISGFKVARVGGQEFPKSGIGGFEAELVVQGAIMFCGAHLTGSTIAFAQGDAGAADTITDSGNGFVTAGFLEGQTVLVEGAGDNAGQYKIKTVAAGTLTLACSGELTDAAAGTAVTLHGGAL